MNELVTPKFVDQSKSEEHAAIAAELLELRQHLASVEFLESSTYGGGYDMITNCRHGGNRSHLTVPRGVVGRTPAQYAAPSLKPCEELNSGCWHGRELREARGLG